MAQTLTETYQIGLNNQKWINKKEMRLFENKKNPKKLKESIKMVVPHAIKSLHNQYKHEPSERNLRLLRKRVNDSYSNEYDRKDVYAALEFKLLDNDTIRK